MRARAARLAVAALLVAVTAPAARADEARYFGVGVLHWRYDEIGTAVEAEGTGLSVRAGTELNDYLDVGAEVGSGGRGDVVEAGTKREVKLELLVRLRARLIIPLSIVRLYVLGGITTVQFESHLVNPGPLGATGPTVFDTSTGAAVGAGAEVRLAGGLFAGVEWVRSPLASRFDLATVSLFARYQFE